MDTGLTWPTDGLTRIPYRLYTDPAQFALEQERIFKGPIWHYLCLANEVPNKGDYIATAIGETPILVTRDLQGQVHAMVNRCAHRGALLCMNRRGNAKFLSCVYHNWSYDLNGDLRGVAFKGGVKGQGGMAPAFEMSEHGLRRLRVAEFSGLVFGTFSDETPSIEDYLGPEIASRMKRVVGKPLKVIGRNTQVLHSNWKVYMENVKDSYHASLLHLFFTTFRLNRLTTKGEIIVDASGGHHVSYSMMDNAVDNADYRTQKLRSDKEGGMTLADPSLIEGVDEFGDGITLQILSVFPTFVVQQIQNAIAVRQVLPKGLDGCELVWTYLGYEDDDETMTRLRIKQGNLVGPAGYISMEDGAVAGFVQRAVKGVEEDSGVVMMGGEGVGSQPFRVTETAVRGFWKRYRELTESSYPRNA
jgi:phenylpropionate dioxygenase-like ring-hydroxylating dioxygenase large terminal subunit